LSSFCLCYLSSLWCTLLSQTLGYRNSRPVHTWFLFFFPLLPFLLIYGQWGTLWGSTRRKRTVFSHLIFPVHPLFPPSLFCSTFSRWQSSFPSPTPSLLPTFSLFPTSLSFLSLSTSTEEQVSPQQTDYEKRGEILWWRYSSTRDTRVSSSEPFFFSSCHKRKGKGYTKAIYQKCHPDVYTNIFPVARWRYAIILQFFGCEPEVFFLLFIFVVLFVFSSFPFLHCNQVIVPLMKNSSARQIWRQRLER